MPDDNDVIVFEREFKVHDEKHKLQKAKPGTRVCQICGATCEGEVALEFGGRLYWFCDYPKHTIHDVIVWFTETLLTQKYPGDDK